MCSSACWISWLSRCVADALNSTPESGCSGPPRPLTPKVPEHATSDNPKPRGRHPAAGRSRSARPKPDHKPTLPLQPSLVLSLAVGPRDRDEPLRAQSLAVDRRDADAGRHRYRGMVRRNSDADLHTRSRQSAAVGAGAPAHSATTAVHAPGACTLRARYRHRPLLAWPALNAENGPVFLVIAKSTLWNRLAPCGASTPDNK